MKPLFQTVAFFDLGVGEARFACVAYASFGQIEIIVQVLQFLAQRGLMAFSFHNFDFAPGKDIVRKKSHRRRTAIWGSARASRAVNDASSLTLLTLSSCSTRGRVEPQPGAATLPISNSRRLLLREAVQRTGAEHQVNGMNAHHRPVPE